jgi:hypothetical protein
MRQIVRVAVIAALVPLAILDTTLPQVSAQQPRPDGAQRSEQAPSLASKDGLSVNKPGALQGYSLIAPLNLRNTYLIDMEGRIVNEWKSEFNPALSAYLLPDGHLLRPAAERGFGPGAGGRIQKFNWDGELVWDYSIPADKFRPHHDICPLPNGNVLVVAHDPKTREEAIAAGRRPEGLRDEFLPDCILEIKPTGKTSAEIVWQWHAWDHLIQDTDKSKPNYGDVSEHPELIDVNYGSDALGRMLANPQQFAQLRALGYVGGGTAPPADGGKDGKNESTDSEKNGKETADKGGKDDAGKDQRDDRKDADRQRGDRRGGGPGGRGGGRPGDWMHVNSVAYNAELDQIMLSIHSFSEAWIIDHGTTTAEAASHKGGKRGKGGDLLYRWGNPQAYRNGTNADQRLFSQHCAHWIAPGLPGAGNMLVYNNGNRRPDGEYSTVDEVELPLTKDGLYQREEFVAYGPGKAKWSYAAPEKRSFFSGLISGAQRLANGNTYICSGNQGILFEVTPEKEIVWMFKYPGAGVFGPGGVRVGQLANDFVRGMLDTSEEQNKSLDKLQADVDAKLAKFLTEEQRKQIAQPITAGPGGPPGPNPGAPGGGGPGGPGPGGPGPRGPGGPPRLGEVLPAPVVESLKLSETQAQELAALQKEVDDQVAKILTDEQKQRIKDVENGRFDRLGRGARGGRDRGAGGRRGGGGPGGIFRSYRYAADYGAFTGKTLTPGKDLEEVAQAALKTGGERPADGATKDAPAKDAK